MMEREALEPERDPDTDVRPISSRGADGEHRPPSRRTMPAAGEVGKVVSLEGGRRAVPFRTAAQSPPALRVSGAASEAQLALLEFLLSSDDAVACAQRGVEWLGEQGGVERILCAAFEPESDRLVGVAGWGLPPPVVSEFSRDLARLDDPLIRATSSGAPQMFRFQPGAPHPVTPFGRTSFMTFPLQGRGPRGDARAGVLLTSPVDCAAARDVRWLAGVLAQKLVGLLGHRDAAGPEVEELARRVELLRRREFALERTMQVRSQFLASMSHELRTPLNAILGYTSMLLQGLGGDVSERQRGMLSRIDANGRSLLSTVNDVLDISRIEGGRMPLVVSEVAVEDVVRGALEELAPVIARSRLAVHAEVCPRLPSLHTDAAKVRQIVLNLLANALKFTEEGSVTIRASIDRAAGQIAVAVSDTGIGIPEAEQERLFEDFQRVDHASTRHHVGAGLGLAICQRLASLLGGRIARASAPGRGSTFTLTLPTDAPFAGDPGGR